MHALRSPGIGTQVHYIPVYQQPFYKRHRLTKGTPCPTAEKYYRESLSIPLYGKMTTRDAKYVAKTLRSFLN